jgi:hypothetical protein
MNDQRHSDGRRTFSNLIVHPCPSPVRYDSTACASCDTDAIIAAAIVGYRQYPNIQSGDVFDLKASLSSLSPEQAATLRKLFGLSIASVAVHSTVSYARR